MEPFNIPWRNSTKKDIAATADPEAEAAWDTEVRERIRGIDEGRVTGVSYEDVMHAAKARLAQ